MFFEECKTIDEAKKLYRQLSTCLHPDKGGNHELMAKLNSEYEKFIKQKEKIDSENKEEAIWLNMISDILQFSQHKKTFNADYITHLLDYYNTYGKFKESQKMSIKNIYDKWRVKQFLEKLQDE